MNPDFVASVPELARPLAGLSLWPPWVQKVHSVQLSSKGYKVMVVIAVGW